MRSISHWLGFRVNLTNTAVAPPGFCNRGEVRYGSIGGLEYEVPWPVPVVLSVYQRGSLFDGLAMYLSCDTKKFHDNESTHILHNFWTSTHRGEASPIPRWRLHCSTAYSVLFRSAPLTPGSRNHHLLRRPLAGTTSGFIVSQTGTTRTAVNMGANDSASAGRRMGDQTPAPVRYPGIRSRTCYVPSWALRLRCRGWRPLIALRTRSD